MPKKIDLSKVPTQTGSSYPPPFDALCKNQSTQRLARNAGLTLFGVNLTVIEPGAWSSQRHWHSHEDEFVWVVEGELDAGHRRRRGDLASPATAPPSSAVIPDGHHLINKSGRPAKVLEIGNSDPNDRCVYSDIDMVAEPGVPHYSHRDGTPYPVSD